MKKLTIEDINREITEGLKLDAEGCRLLIKKLKPVQRSLETVVKREKAKRAERIAALNEYKTEQDIQDAYGYGYISDDERRQLLEMLETGEKYVEDVQTKTSVALHLLREFVGRLSRQANSYEFELMPPEEQAKRLAATEEIRKRADARRAARKEALS